MASGTKWCYQKQSVVPLLGIMQALACWSADASDFHAKIEVGRERMPLIEELEYLRSNSSGQLRQLVDQLIDAANAGNQVFYNFYIWLEPQGGAEITSATLITPTNATHDLAPEENGEDWELDDLTFISLNELSTAFPSGTYTLNVTFSGGATATKTASIPVYDGFPRFVAGRLDEDTNGQLKLVWNTVSNVGEYEIDAELLPTFDEVFDSDNLYINHPNTTVTPLGVSKNTGQYFISVLAEQQIVELTALQIGVEFNSFTSWTTLYDDTDKDRIADQRDNCVSESNADQEDFDNDALGDACDPDDDNDGVAESPDAFPSENSESVDTDSDSIGNNADPDDDGDELSDVDEGQRGSQPLIPDTDGDGMLDGAEVSVGRSPVVNEPAILGVLNQILSES